jgi:hypothetical protein
MECDKCTIAMYRCLRCDSVLRWTCDVVTLARCLLLGHGVSVIAAVVNGAVWRYCCLCNEWVFILNYCLLLVN